MCNIHPGAKLYYQKRGNGHSCSGCRLEREKYGTAYVKRKRVIQETLDSLGIPEQPDEKGRYKTASVVTYDFGR